MALDKPAVRQLLEFVAKTRDDEIDCGACLAGMAEFAELELVGAELPDALRRIEAHVESCPECAEEYALLRDVLQESIDEPVR